MFRGSHRSGIKRVLQVGVAVVGLTGASAFGDTFSVRDDWNFTPPNSGVFIYGVADQVSPAIPYAFAAYSEQIGGGPGTNEVWRLPGQVDPNVRLNLTGGFSFGVADDLVALHPAPDNRMSVIRLNQTFASNQVVNISGSFGAGDQGAVDVYIVDFGFGAGNTMLFSLTGISGDAPFNLNFLLPAGHTIDFLVGSAGNYLFDSTPLAATISTREVGGAVPEPASALLLVVGAAGLAAIRRQLR